MKKRALKMMCVMAATGLLLASQGSAVMAESTDNGETMTIQFWHTRGSGPNYEAVQHEVETFNDTIGKEKGIEVQETYIGDYNEILTKLSWRCSQERSRRL